MWTSMTRSRAQFALGDGESNCRPRDAVQSTIMGSHRSRWQNDGFLLWSRRWDPVYGGAGRPPAAFLLVSLLRSSPQLASPPTLHANAKIQSSFVSFSCACACACSFHPSRFRCRLGSHPSFPSPEPFFLAQLEFPWAV